MKNKSEKTIGTWGRGLGIWGKIAEASFTVKNAFNKKRATNSTALQLKDTTIYYNSTTSISAKQQT